MSIRLVPASEWYQLTHNYSYSLDTAISVIHIQFLISGSLDAVQYSWKSIELIFI